MLMAHKVATVGGATLVSRVLAFVRDAAIAALLGAGPVTDAFFAILQLTNFFRRLLSESALNAAFVPMWLRLKKSDGEKAAIRFAQNAFVAMAAGAAILCALAIWFAPQVIGFLAPGFSGSERHLLGVDYLRLAAPYVVLAASVSVLAAILNAEGRVTAAAIGTVSFNGVILLALLFIALTHRSATTAGLILAFAITAGGLAQMVITAAGLAQLPYRSGKPIFFFCDDTLRLFQRALPSLVATGIPQLKLIAGTIIASSSPAAVSWLYFANRLYELPLGVASTVMAAALAPAIAANLHTEQAAASQSRALEIALGLALPAAIGLGLLALPIASGLFQRGAFGPQDSLAVAAALAAIAAGLPGHTLEKYFGAISFAHEDTRTPMLAALAGLASAVAIALALFPAHGHVGIAAAIAMSGWVGATLMALTVWRRGWLRIEPATWSRLGRIAGAAIVMALCLASARWFFDGHPGHSMSARAGVLTVLVGLGVASYVASLHLLGVARLNDLLAAMRRSQ